MKKMRIRMPDNWHGHLRQDDLLDRVARHFNIYGRVLCMGNTKPLIETADDALQYKSNILEKGVSFEPVMCIMLTQDTTPETIFDAVEKGIRFVKFIPVGTSTGAVKGLRLDDFDSLYKIFPVIEETGCHLLIHSELVSDSRGKEIHLLDREETAIRIIADFHNCFQRMKITVEHASTAAMINFIRRAESLNLRATLAPQHAVLTYADVFNIKGELLDPYCYCLPVVKRERDRKAVVEAMVSGDERFFAGADSAPHWAHLKASSSPPPGIFFGPAEFPLWFEIFEIKSALSKLEDFTSRFGAEYYGFPLNQEFVYVIWEDWKLLEIEDGIHYSMGGITLSHRIIKEK